jgi:hypothetical protein
VSLSGNTFSNTYENITGVSYLTAPAINVSDNAGATGLINISADNNIIHSEIGNGITFKNYTKVTANGNTITDTPLDGISIFGTSGTFYGNNITDVGTLAAPASGILINGNASGLYVAANTAGNTTTGTNRTTDYVIKIGSANNGVVAPKIISNKGKNTLKGIVSEYYYQLNYVQASNNTAL